MPTSSARCTTNTTVSHALKIYFWGNYFLNVVEYTGNLQGDYAFKTLFFFFLRKGLVYLLRSVFLNILWTREAPLIDALSLPHSLQGWAEAVIPRPLSRSPNGWLPLSSRYTMSASLHHLVLGSPCAERKGMEASLGRPSSLAPPLLVCPPLSPESQQWEPQQRRSDPQSHSRGLMATAALY